MTEQSTINKIKKRNGEMVSFDKNKIRDAIHKANIATHTEKMTSAQLDELTQRVVTTFDNAKTPTVEKIQDRVEEVLIEADFAKTAKAYILYRAEHTKIRQSEADLMDIYKELTFSYAADTDIKRENANIDADTAMGTMLKYGSEGSKYFIDNYVLPKDIAAAHINGDIHIH
ncbi:MAG: anaerobic ribonucleoside-triphosphate reductase, partial [Oscillospiraceae bacterium]